jgi:small-conductance mechanosensitive channel
VLNSFYLIFNLTAEGFWGFGVLGFWISDPTGGLTNIRGNVFLALWDNFAANGISIPFPQREIKVHKNDQLPD